MIPVSTLSGRRVALFGLGGSGLATAGALAAGGAEVVAWDDNAASLDAARAAGIAVADLREADWPSFAAFVLSPGVPLTHPEPHWSVGLAREAGVGIVGDIELFCRERAAHAPAAPLIAVTGTNGKSTTTALIHHVLVAAGVQAQVGGNLGRAALALDPLGAGGWYVLEASSYQLETIETLRWDVAVFLNITPDHLDRYQDLAGYVAAKRRMLAAQTSDGTAVIGIDDDWSEAPSYRPITFASLAPGDFVFEVQARSPSGEWSATPASFAFQVATPLWARPWFWTLLGLVVLGLLWSGIRFRIQQVEARRRELEGLVRERTLALEQANQKLEEASLTDPLTGLANRRYLSRQVATDVAQSRRAYRGDSVLPNRDIIFLMVDIDHFKRINDTWGHLAGDEVLRQFAALLRSEIRESDYVVRWGGEEFLIVARQTEAGLCSIMAERIVKAARAHAFTIDDSGRTIQCTCSIGVSHFPFCRDDPDAFTWEQVLDMADASVYLAKASGRDGWMAVRNSSGERIRDTAAFVTAVKSNPTAMAGQGRIRIEGTHAASLMRSIARDPTQA